MRTLGVAALAIIVLVAILWLLQRRLIYLPVGAVPPAPNAVEEVTIPTEDGLELPGWLLAPQGEAVATVVVFNGNAGNRAHRLPLAESLAASGFEVLLFDYRGYGDAPGSPSQPGLERDGRAVGRFLDTRGGGPVVYFGESLGAAVAVGLATERPPDVLVLRSPFTSLVDVARVHYPILPVGLLVRDRWEVVDPLRNLDVPVLVIAGEEDSIVPLDQSRRVFDAAPDPKGMVVFDGANHNDPELTGGPAVGRAVRRFVETIEP